MPAAKTFAPPRPVEFEEEELERIARHVKDEYRKGVQARIKWNNDHAVYNDMWRGRHNLDRRGPWEGSANIHVQAPYWLVDAINVRMMMGIWNQVPLVVPEYHNDLDAERAKRAAHLVEHHLQHPTPDFRGAWNRASKIRLTHGYGFLMPSYVHDQYDVRTIDPSQVVDDYVIDKTTGLPREDDQGNLIIRPKTPEPTVETLTYYQGPVPTVLDYDDVVLPIGAQNPQPLRPSNPRGSEWVNVRQWEKLWLMLDKSANETYPFMLYGDRDERWWIDNAPDQLRSGGGEISENQRHGRAEDRAEGMNRSFAGGHQEDENPNPEIEVLTHFGKWRDPETGALDEFVFFVSIDPNVTLGAFYLSDWYWKAERPLIDLHYQTTGTRFYSMGVMELCRRLSNELDTIHNMRLDVGFLTNMPFFFYRATSGFSPENVILRPMRAIPVDDPRDFVFPQMGNVTAFYHQEETLTLTLLERVMGVTDLFLGVSPTRGASARHATGFVGTQQEAEARMSEILSQDARAFSRLCRMIYNMELQYGPEERSFRLQGDERSDQYQNLKLEDIWMIGEYDFKVGANYGSFSQTTKQQQAQALHGILANEPLVMQDAGKRWEMLNTVVQSYGFRSPEKYIGRKEDVAGPVPKRQSEENEAMAQFQFGVDAPAPVHPADNDEIHIREALEFVNSSVYDSLGRPNLQGFIQHVVQHTQQADAKRAMAAQQMFANQGGATPGGSAPPGGAGGANPMNRAGAQIQNVPSGGGAGFGDMFAAQTAGGGQ